MFIVRPEDRFHLVEALSGAGALAASVVFTDDGCQSWKTHG
jgi:hypothetical protein